LEKINCVPLRQRDHRAVQTDANPGNGHVEELWFLVLGGVILLQGGHQLGEHILWHLAASSFEIREPGEPEGAIQIVGRGIEWTTQLGVATAMELQVGRVQNISGVAHLGLFTAEQGCKVG